MFDGFPFCCSQSQSCLPCLDGYGAEHFHRDRNNNGRDHDGEDYSSGKKTITGGWSVQRLSEGTYKRHYHDNTPESINDGWNGSHDIDDPSRQLSETAMSIF